MFGYFIFFQIQKNFWEESWFGLIIAIAVVIAIVLLSYLIIRLSKSIPQKTDGNASNELQKCKEEIDILIKQNKSLEKRIGEKDHQIKRLQKATQELSKMNNELKQQTEKLDGSNAEIKKLQDKKEELLKMKEDMFGAIVHDIKNPVGLIRGFAELLNSYDLSRQEQSDIIRAILETSDKMVTLSEEMTKLIVIDAEVLALSKKPVQINHLIENVIQSNFTYAHKKEINLFANLKTSIPEIIGDGVRLEEVVDNLVNNAIKYSYSKGKIEVISEYTNSNIVVHIKDNGLGISEDEIKRVFLPLQKLSSKPTANEPSSGVGLSIAKKIIELHNGKIWVQSKIGEGSVFSFSIPVN